MIRYLYFYLFSFTKHVQFNPLPPIARIRTRFSPFFRLASRLVDGSGAARVRAGISPGDVRKPLVTIRCHRNGYYYPIHFDYETNFGACCSNSH